MKCNKDGASRGSPSQAAYGANFCDGFGAFRGCIALSLGVKFSLYAELLSFVLAIEHAHYVVQIVVGV